MTWPEESLTLPLEDLSWVISAPWRVLNLDHSESIGLMAREKLKTSKAWSWMMLGEAWDG